MRPRGPAKRPQRSERSVALFNAAKGLEGLGIVEDRKSLISYTRKPPRGFERDVALTRRSRAYQL